MLKIMIASGKGGVGKTTIALELARGLTKEGFKVGIIDCDIDCPNINNLLKVTKEVDIEEHIQPINIENMEFISLGLFFSDSAFVSWDSTQRSAAVLQFLNAVDWSNDLDFLILDTPPGTSDEVRFIAESQKPDMTFIISTPEESSLIDAKRSILMLQANSCKVSGVIMNRTRCICPECNANIYVPSVIDAIHEIPVICDIPIKYTSNIDLTDVVEFIKSEA